MVLIPEREAPPARGAVLYPATGRRGNLKLLNYPGSKWALAEEIAGLIPKGHRTYLEPYFGSGAVFFTKEPSPIEIVNDRDGDVANFFQMVRDAPLELARRLELTPYAREVFDGAWADRGSDPMDRAVRFAVRSKMGFGYKCHTKTGFKIDLCGREAGYAVREWAAMPEVVMEAARRLRDAFIENRPALELIRKCDDARAVIYADPPYLMDTRGGRQYNHEMSRQDHEELLHELLHSRASVILSGYRHELYDDALKGWYRIERDSRNQNKERRTEVLWCSFEPEGAGRMRLEDV